jgi:hypothetical protein
LQPLQPDPGLQKVSISTSNDIVRLLARAGVQASESPHARDDAGGDSELRVAGTVDRIGGKYVVEAQILDRRSGVVLWSDHFEEGPNASGVLPEEIASAVAFILHCALDDRKAARQPLSTTAFGLYVNACAGVGVHAPERMLAVTRRLVKAAPKFAGAHAMHGIAAGLAANDGDRTPAETAALRAEGMSAARKALELDPHSAKAYVASELNQDPGDLVARERDLTRALEIDPDLPPPRVRYVQLLQEVGRFKEALQLVERTAQTGDPRASSVDPLLPLVLAAMGDLAGAHARLDAMEAQTPLGMRGARWTIAVWWDDPATALPKVRALGPDAGTDKLSCIERFLSELPRRKAARLRGLPPGCETLDLTSRIRMLGREGDVEGAFAAMPQRLPPEGIATAFLFYPEMKALRADPRFMALAARLGLVDYWRTTGHWPDFCSEPGLPYDCKVEAAKAAGARHG